MSVTLTPVPAAPRATVDFVRVTVAAADQSTLTGYDGTLSNSGTMPGSPAQYPASPEVRYYLTFELDGVIRGKSYVFSTDTDGGHEFNNYCFPEAGDWTIRLNAAADDSSVQTQAVTVS